MQIGEQVSKVLTFPPSTRCLVFARGRVSVTLCPFGPVFATVPVEVAPLNPVMARLSVIVQLVKLRLNELVAVAPFGRVAVIVRPKLPPPLSEGVNVRL